MSSKDVESFDDEEEERSVYEADTKSSTSSAVESRVLTRVEAGECLHTLGKCDSGNNYAYLGMDASNRLLTDVSVIPTFRHVIFVNVSGNLLTSDALRVFGKMTYILMLEIDRNELEYIDLEPMPYLQILTLNKNKLRYASGISHKSLERLEMNYNEIHAVTLNPYALENLSVLELRGNRLTSTAGIFFPGLVRLYLAENRIKRITGLGALVNLKILHLRKNKLSNLDGFDAQCKKLHYINLRENKITELDEFCKLSVLPCLETIIIIDNPVVVKKDVAQDHMEYRLLLLSVLTSLKRIDKDPVLHEEKKVVEEIKNTTIANDSCFENVTEGENSIAVP